MADQTDLPSMLFMLNAFTRLLSDHPLVSARCCGKTCSVWRLESLA